jgi:hypothetical protein
MTEFKVGDKITTNPEWDEYFRDSTWWQLNKNKPMTIEPMTIRKIIIIRGDIVYEVHENDFRWRKDWMIKVEDFIKESEFLI